jgi:hypothetical protein
MVYCRDAGTCARCGNIEYYLSGDGLMDRLRFGRQAHGVSAARGNKWGERKRCLGGNIEYIFQRKWGATEMVTGWNDGAH